MKCSSEGGDHFPKTSSVRAAAASLSAADAPLRVFHVTTNFITNSFRVRSSFGPV
jgi:hypothetical protein